LADEVVINEKNLRRAVIKFPSRLFVNLEMTIRKEMRFFVDDHIKQRLSGRKGNVGLNRRTGNLKDSFLPRVVSKGKDLTTLRGFAGFTKQVPYARIHELGGEIKPVNAKFLAIPLAAAKTPAGVARIKPREVTNSVFITTKSGGRILAQKNGKNITPFFLLVKSVKIPPRLELVARWSLRCG